MSKDLLRDFKGNHRTPPPLHPLETTLIWIAALNLCSLPWMLGGMRTWAQFISLGLSVVAFAIALVPRVYDGELINEEAYRTRPWKRLVHWPLFWVGLIFFGYILIQALNPAWEFVQLFSSWMMRPIEHITWLPTGMRTPFEMMNPWRQMMIWGAPFLLACALWTGFTRKKSVVTLLTAITANATVLALVGIVARFTANGSILWLVDSRKNYAYASFIYKNHAGSFFALAVGLSTALAIHHHLQASRNHRRSSPAPLLIFAAMISAVAVLQSYSRAAIILTGVFVILVGVAGLIRVLTRGGARQMLLIVALFAVASSVFIGLGSKLVNSKSTISRFEALSESSSVWRRQIAWDAGLEMANDHPAYGWGAGGFRFLFPKYQHSRPGLSRPEWNPKLYYFWEFIHNDYLQVLIETGRIGASWIAVGGVLYLVLYLRHRGFRNLPAVTLLGTAGIILAHAAIDFPLQNPAILTTLTATLTFALIFVSHDGRARS